MVGGLESEPEYPLEKALAGLERASTELGAKNLAVLVLEGPSIEMAYPAALQIDCGEQLREALMNASGPACAEHPLAAFLGSAIAPGASSFLLIPWQARRRVVLIVFGFGGRQPAHCSIPSHVADSINLAGLAAWSAKEIAHLRAELRAMNCQFAGRKLVERAKGILQTRHGMNEQQAYEYLRKMSRQRRIAITKLAQDLVGAARCP